MTGGAPTPEPIKRSALTADRPSGQSLVEFAVFAPVLLLVLVMAIDLGRVYFGWVNLTNVARIGANYAAAHPDAWQGSGNAVVQTRYRQLMARDASQINCTLPATLPAPAFLDSSYDVGSRVRVDLDCAFRLMTPLLTNLIGDGAGNVTVRSSAEFQVRYGSIDAGAIGGTAPSAAPTSSPTPAPTPTAVPTPTATPLPSGVTPAPASPTPQPPVVSFYGTPASSDSSGGGAPGSVDENLIVGIPNLLVNFTNTTTGDQGICRWQFGDGGESTSCGNSVSHTYSSRGLFTASLTVDGQAVTRANYILVTCKVPAFAGVRVGSADWVWTNAGFVASNLSALPGNGNYKIGYQSLVGGLVNPPGGCSGAVIQVGE